MRSRLIGVLLVMGWSEGLGVGCGEARDESRRSDATRLGVEVGGGARFVPLGAFDARAAGLCDGAPVERDGAAVWVDAGGLWRLPLGASAPERLDDLSGFSTSSPVALDGATLDGPGLALALGDADGCRLRAYARDDGRRLWETRLPGASCTSPAVAGRLLVWAHGGDGSDGSEGGGGGDGGARLTWIERERGQAMTSVALDAAPLTGAVAFGNDVVSGGGSHWLVGTADAIVAVRDPLTSHRLGEDPDPDPVVPTIAGRWSAPARVTSLVMLDDTAVASLGDAPGALGDRLQPIAVRVVTQDHLELTPLGPPIRMPGPITAHPITLACAGADAWYCHDGAATAEGAVVAAGDGWIGAWLVPSGRRAWQRTSDVAWTGIAGGRGGWVAGGGSHWLPSGERGWIVSAIDPRRDAPITLGDGAGDACVPSPLWDNDGDLTLFALGPDAAVATRVVRVTLEGLFGARGLAVGFPRPHGDAHNRAARIAAPYQCVDGTIRGGGSVPLGRDTIHGLSHAPGHTVAFGERDERGLLRWLPEVGEARERVLPDALPLELVVARPNGEALVTHVTPGSTLAYVAQLGEGVTPTFEHFIGQDIGSLVGLVPNGERRWLLGTTIPAIDRLYLVDELGGLQETRVFDVDQGIVGLVRLLPRPSGGATLVSRSDTRITLRNVDAAMAPTPAIDVPMLAPETRVIDARADGAGAIRVLLDQTPLETSALDFDLVVLDADLTVVDRRSAPLAGPFATHAGGTSLVFTPEGWARVAPSGAFNPPRRPSLFATDPSAQALDFALAPTDTGFVVAATRLAPGGERELVWAFADLRGYFSCEDAGACGDAPPDVCDDASACAVQGCEPTDGSCVASPAPLCVP